MRNPFHCVGCAPENYWNARSRVDTLPVQDPPPCPCRAADLTPAQRAFLTDNVPPFNLPRCVR